ncbi:hypothetical protein Ahy_B09g095287 [Arachis hypogaea]|uniref:Uncharacterized protein n=1 Tax=Arachis hypogaea TaxID=3818 RepID=A0A444XDD7_ARAHY|nr:hypothetical protein Ahy_B09g095287 [Arachis hypogaea]
MLLVEQGAKQLYTDHLHPFLLRQQARLDQVVDVVYGEMICFNLLVFRIRDLFAHVICIPYQQIKWLGVSFYRLEGNQIVSKDKRGCRFRILNQTKSDLFNR